MKLDGGNRLDPVQPRVALPAANPPDNRTDIADIPSDGAWPPRFCFYLDTHDFSSANRDQWFGNIRGDVLAGIVVALALIPEAIAFSIIAGVDPKVGLYASFSIAVIIAITGGRPGMISAATAATAVLMVTLVRDMGLSTCSPPRSWPGILQVLAGSCRLGYLMRFVSRSVMTGFVNALAILIFMAQLPELIGVPLADLRHDRGGPGDHLPVPAAHEGDPSPLVCIIVLTAITLALGHRRAHRRRHGRVAVDAAGVPAPRHAAHPGNAADHPSLLGQASPPWACWNRC